MADLYQQNKISPSSFKRRQVKLESWVTLERTQIEQAKVGFKQEWEKTMLMIEQTKSDQEFMRSKVESLSSRRAEQTDSNEPYADILSPNEPQPSAEFITRLEKALLPLSSEMTLDISEQFIVLDGS